MSYTTDWIITAETLGLVREAQKTLANNYVTPELLEQIKEATRHSQEISKSLGPAATQILAGQKALIETMKPFFDSNKDLLLGSTSSLRNVESGPTVRIELPGPVKAAAEKFVASALASSATRHLSGASRNEVLSNKAIASSFEGEHDCAVVSMDIRGSTDLMLKSHTPQQFAEFISALTIEFARIVETNHGLVDKFTGDGVLAYFPTFYAGPDAIVWSLKCAVECHEAFEKIYREHHGSFATVRKAAGIGIGIDYGSVTIMMVAQDATIVGKPVVYACRLGGAPAGETRLNIGAKLEAVNRNVSPNDFDQTEQAIKGDDEPIVVYRYVGKEPQAGSVPPWR